MEDSDRQRLFDSVLKRHKRGLMAVARCYAQEDESQELCREILLEIWSNLHAFESTCRLGTFVYRIALNTASTYGSCARHRRRFPLKRSHEPVVTVGTKPSREVSTLEGFVRSLKGVDRCVFLLFLENLNCREVSEVTGLDEADIGTKITRLRNSLKTHALEHSHESQFPPGCMAQT
jgi:RNA polymerase sigma-70 factor (ECF subfamily)